MSVQRYLIAMREDQFGNCDLHKDDCGDGVRHEDYAALEARCAGLERDDTLTKIKHLKAALLTQAQRVPGYIQREQDANAGKIIAEQERDALQAKLAAAVSTLGELHALVRGECPSLLDEDSGGSSRLDLEIRAVLPDATTGEVQP